ncbi:hypothetical protein A2678_00230 [Candidatus Kaiserbacteria bacterium RIFCSPHIGHO2_01_FULL_53_31]|uniref:Pilus assembly protein PilO n=1 Tax=Candidatus Kaiserbacteria bacterium RIFCSPHIGHO2_01_FULL_53_31 TaxID=1798481 RepID=A0A1F6CHD9_9BACT|nr:MAG: hypothetical protein A2678_00230 [Candidatus Kaiserbacteria bacterium RIFCSPHIGHO2_01_FULL_53_31]
MNNRAVALLALFLAAGILFGYTYPMWAGSIADTKAAIERDNQALDAARAYADRQRELMAARDAIDPANLARLTNFLPDSVDNVGLIVDLNALAARSGFSLSSIDVSASTVDPYAVPDGNPVGSVELSLSAVGTYGSFQKFLKGVEESERLLDVRDLSITGSNSGMYTYDMSTRFYWLR